MKNQKINCTVYNCRYCDITHNKCNLEQISIVNHSLNNPKEATLCDSFSEK